MKTPTRDEMIDKIYEEIANKELRVGCIIGLFYKEEPPHRFAIRYPEIYENGAIKEYTDLAMPTENAKIMGQPVMIGDVLEYALTKGGPRLEDKLLLRIISQRTQARKQIEDQSDECVRFVYSLIVD